MSAVQELEAPAKRTGGGSPRGTGLFRAFWRWHFYASFLVIPVLLILAATGLIYLFRFQLEPVLHAGLMKVDQPAGLVLLPLRLLASPPITVHRPRIQAVHSPTPYTDLLLGHAITSRGPPRGTAAF